MPQVDEKKIIDEKVSTFIKDNIDFPVGFVVSEEKKAIIAQMNNMLYSNKKSDKDL